MDVCVRVFQEIAPQTGNAAGDVKYRKEVLEKNNYVHLQYNRENAAEGGMQPSWCHF